MALSEEQCKCGLAFLASRSEHSHTTNHLYEPGDEEEGESDKYLPEPGTLPQPLVINFTVEQLEEGLTVAKCHLGIEGSKEQRVQRYARAMR
jgi:hypothetical protein